MTPLRIAQVAPLWARVPPKTYGGIELRLSWLTEELVERGHDVTLLASGDSLTGAQLHAVCEQNLLDLMERGEAYQYEYYANAALADALRAAEAFDVVHSHLGCAQIPLSLFSSVPVLHTLPTMLTIDEQWLLRRYPDVHLAAISHAQAAAIPAGCHNVHVVHHGCDFSRYELSAEPEGILAFIGRMGPQKAPAAAIRIARLAGMPIVLAGQPQDAHERAYFESEVRPLLDGEDVVHVGPVNQAEKVDLLRRASALLFPIEREEAFGLVMIEAMACGTPVVAARLGAIPEIVDYGETGFYAGSIEELAALVPAAGELDRARVRQLAMERFSHTRMVDEYVALYEALAADRDR